MTKKRATRAVRPAQLGSSGRLTHPALDDAVSSLTRRLSAAASRPVTVTRSAPTQASTAALSSADTHWWGSRSGVCVGIRHRGAPMLAELALSLAPDASRNQITPAEARMLRAAFLPMLTPLTATLTGDSSPVDLGTVTGDDALAGLAHTPVATRLTLTVTAQDAAGRTVTSEVVIVAPAPAAAGHRAPVSLDDLSGRFGDIPLPVRVTLPPTRVSARRLATLQPGEVLLTAATTQTPWLVWVGDTLVASARIGHSQNRRSVGLDMTWRQNPMTEQVLAGLAAAQDAVERSATEPGAATGGLGVLGNVPVEVCAELGRVKLQLRDVAAFHPGQVLELNAEPDAPFALVVNDVVIGTAEAVVVDGQLGLRIIELTDR